MNTSSKELRIVSLSVTDRFLTAALSDGRIVSNPIEWYPRLKRGDLAARNEFELSGEGSAVHWEKLDEDLSAAGIAEGVPSFEYVRSVGAKAIQFRLRE